MKPKIVAKMTKREATEYEREFAEKKANATRLDGCLGPHDFQPCKVSEIVEGWVTRWRCPMCRGEVDRDGKEWYERGLRHGGAK